MALWGNKDLVYSDGTISINLGTNVITGSGTTFTTAGIGIGDVITVGAGATYGYAVISAITSNSQLSIASTQYFVSGITTVPSGTSYSISQEPIYTLGDSVYRAPESKTVGTSTVFTAVFGVDANEVGTARTITVGGKAAAYAVAHSGWVGVTTYIDTHGNLRVKSEVLVAGGIDTASGTDAADDTRFPDSTITITTQPASFDELNEDNYLLFAIKFYDNPQSVTKDDFEDDLKRIKYVKRLLKRYRNTGVLKTHLILNHLIILFNVFNDATIPLLFYNLDVDLWPIIKSFLMFLNRIPEYPKTHIHEIEEDKDCLVKLQSI